ncbi:MAG: DOPA 4,5-dioxygenase family protein [Inhella sp.]
MLSDHPDRIQGWHAHVYFDAARRERALALRARIATELGERVRIGRFNEGPVGPHPQGSYELEIDPAQFGFVLSWLVLNHGGLDLFIHPNTDDGLRDHRDSALWLGHMHALKLDALNE